MIPLDDDGRYAMDSSSTDPYDIAQVVAWCLWSPTMRMREYIDDVRWFLANHRNVEPD